MNNALKLVLLGCLILGGVAVFTLTPAATYLSPQKLITLVESLRESWSLPILLILVYGLGGLIALPATPLTIVIGAIYGLWAGLLLNTLAANLNATLAFLSARFLGRDFVEKRLKGKIKGFDERASKNGFNFIFYLRLVPLFPFLGINLMAGLSGIKFRSYALATLLGMLPGTFVYTYFASSLLGGVDGAKEEATLHLALSSGLLILLSILPLLIKKFRKKR
jgi:uncharacterized membrane protein YdjX (TVP38/TMEM64 family)